MIGDELYCAGSYKMAVDYLLIEHRGRLRHEERNGLVLELKC
jgi:hypothetical protein